MRLYIFDSTKEPDVMGFTGDETGSNLPTEFAPWSRSTGGSIIIESDAVGMPRMKSSAIVFAAIEKDGFYIVRSETIAGMTDIP